MKDHGIVYGEHPIPPKRLGDPWSAVNEAARKRERDEKKPRIVKAVERLVRAYRREKAAFDSISIARLCNG